MNLNVITGTRFAKSIPGEARPQWVGRFRARRFETLTLLWTDAGLTALRFAEQAPDEHMSGGERKSRIPGWLADPLEAYFDGDGGLLRAIPLAIGGTSFQQRVWAALREIPFGTVQSYGALARGLGSPRGMRAVGMANGANPTPIVVPCHRVVQAGLRLGGYRGGAARKRFLLSLEAVPVDGDRVLPGQLALRPGQRAVMHSHGPQEHGHANPP